MVEAVMNTYEWWSAALLTGASVYSAPIRRWTPDERYGMKLYDRVGRPMSMAVWGQLCADFEYKVVQKTEVDIHGETVQVSTVWLGLDHGFMSEEPIIFETMVFGEVDGHDMSDVMQERYCTEAEALEGHAMAVAACRRLGAIEPDPEQAELTE